VESTKLVLREWDFDGNIGEHDDWMTKIADKRESAKVRIGKRCFVGEHAAPQVLWVEDAVCPICGCNQLMDAHGMALCVSCNKFVKPKRTG